MKKKPTTYFWQNLYEKNATKIHSFDTIPFSNEASYYFTDSPDQLNEPVMHFTQVGPPRNMTVQQTDDGDEFVVSWEPPEYRENLRIYIVRWFREPGHNLEGSAETSDTYYKGSHFSFSFDKHFPVLFFAISFL